MLQREVRDFGPCLDGRALEDINGARALISGARIGCGGGRGQGAGARYRVRGRCAVEGGDKGRERDIGCADGARWRGGSAISADGARWRAWTRGGSAISGAQTVRGGGRGQGAGARYRVRGRCAVEGGDKGRERDIGCADGARWRAGTRGGSAISGARTVRGGGRGQEESCGLLFCHYSLRLGFRVPGLTLCLSGVLRFICKICQIYVVGPLAQGQGGGHLPHCRTAMLLPFPFRGASQS